MVALAVSRSAEKDRCGPLAARLVLQYFGRALDGELPAISTLDELALVLKGAGLDVRTERLPPEELRKLRAVAVLKLTSDVPAVPAHVVVVLPLADGSLTIVDPTAPRAVRFLTLNDVLSRWNGTILNVRELEASARSAHSWMTIPALVVGGAAIGVFLRRLR